MGKFSTYDQARNSLSLREKVGQSFMPAAFINDTEEGIRRIENLIEKCGIGGLCFFHSRASAATNYEGPKEVIYNEESLVVLQKLIKRYQKASKYPLLISIDAEWGLAMRIENTRQYPYAITLGAMVNQEPLIYQVGRHIGLDCSNAGIHWNFAPVADINTNPKNPVIGYRSFGENPVLVSKYSLALYKGLQSAGVLASAKHFPGHGDTAVDSHLGLPKIDKSSDSLWSNELIPFRQLIDQGIDSIMVGHLAVPSLSGGITEPASLSKEIIQGLLRQKLAFEGVVVSDALNMHAVSKMFDQKGTLERKVYEAGTDVICYGEHVEAGIEAILEQSDERLIEDRFSKVWNLKEKVFGKPDALSEGREHSYEELMKMIARKSLCRIRGTDEDLRLFKNSKYNCLAIGTAKQALFFQRITGNSGTQFLSTHEEETDKILAKLQQSQNVLVALYPPEMKPRNNFGLSESVLKLLNTLSLEKDVMLYLFGNPYVLNLLELDQFKGIWIGFQEFEEFQYNAARHFRGEIDAPGKLSITIQTD